MGPGFVPQVRAAALQTYFEVAREVGIDPIPILRRHKLGPEDLVDSENLIPAAALVGIYEQSAQKAGREDFGLLMAQSRSLASLGPISLLLRYQPTVGAILHQVIDNVHLLTDIGYLRMEDHDRATMIRVEMMPGYASRQTIEAAVAIAFGICRELVESAWQPDAVHFRHRAPASLATHVHLFRCPLVFDSEFDGIVCSAAALDAPNPLADATMAAHAQRFIDMLREQRTGQSAAEQTRQAILQLIASGQATKERVAESLAMHPRSLQRMLARENTSFGELLAQARRDLALRYLSDSTQSVTEIAVLLGYATVSSFTRWFTDEFGKSPAAWRKAASEAERPPIAKAG